MPWMRLTATSGSSPSGIMSPMPGMDAMMSFIAAHLRHLLELLAEVVEREVALLPASSAAVSISSCDSSCWTWRTFSIRPMMSPWPRMRWAMPSGRNSSRPVQLLADADELDRHLGDFLDRQRRAAAGVAVELGQDDAVEFEGVVERLGAVDGVLAGHGVADQVDLVGLDEPVDLLQLVHRHLGDVQPAGGVEDDRVEQLRSWRGRRRCGRRRPAWAAGGGFAEDRDADLLAEDLELLDGGGTLQVGGDQQRLAAALAQASGRACRPWSFCR